jgi:glycosyltransferase involved in cell wall biosynthesis
MKILHITEDNSKTNFGITMVVNDLNKKLNGNNIINSKIIAPIINDNDFETIFVKPTLQNKIWNHSLELEKKLNLEKDNIFHIHGIWMYPQYIASKIAYKNDIPYLITPHGMLEPWLWESGTLKKKLYFNLMIKKYFSNANILHAITPNEKENLFELFKHKNIEVIPNSISYNDIKILELKERQNIEPYILFVGRLDQIKGIDILIKALYSINDKKIILKIAGPNSIYKEELVKLIKDLGLESRVEFLGMVSGKEKFQLYRDAWVFVAPSYSEVVGMVNLEAGIMGTPVITTHQTGLYQDWNDNGGILINPDVDELVHSLNEAISWSNFERNDRGRQLKKFIIEKYSWENNIFKWIELYKELNNAKAR